MATEVTVTIYLDFDDPDTEELVADIEAIEYVRAADVVDIWEV